MTIRNCFLLTSVVAILTVGADPGESLGMDKASSDAVDRVLRMMIDIIKEDRSSKAEVVDEQTSDLEDRSLGAIIEDLRNGSIAAVEVIHVPYRMQPEAPLGSDGVRRSSTYRQTTSLDQDSRRYLAFVLELEQISPLDGPARDPRWGILMRDGRGKEIHSMFLAGRFVDGTGRTVEIDGKASAASGLIGVWLESVGSDWICEQREPEHWWKPK